MKYSNIFILPFFLMYLAYKLFADECNLYHVNAYWFCSSAFYCLLFYEISNIQLLKVRKLIWRVASAYWGVMLLFHAYCFFNIDFYLFVKSANKLTVGATTLMLAFIYLFSIRFKNDNKNA